MWRWGLDGTKPPGAQAHTQHPNDATSGTRARNDRAGRCRGLTGTRVVRGALRKEGHEPVGHGASAAAPGGGGSR